MLFEHEIFEMQYDFPKMGGGLRAVWNFSENSSVLVPLPGLIEACVDFDQIDNNDFYSSTS